MAPLRNKCLLGFAVVQKSIWCRSITVWVRVLDQVYFVTPSILDEMLNFVNSSGYCFYFKTYQFTSYQHPLTILKFTVLVQNLTILQSNQNVYDIDFLNERKCWIYFKRFIKGGFSLRGTKQAWRSFEFNDEMLMTLFLSRWRIRHRKDVVFNQCHFGTSRYHKQSETFVSN